MNAAVGARVLSDAEKIALEASDSKGADSATETGSGPPFVVEAAAIVIVTMREAVKAIVLTDNDGGGGTIQRIELVVDYPTRLQAAMLLLGATVQAVQNE